MPHVRNSVRGTGERRGAASRLLLQNKPGKQRNSVLLRRIAARWSRTRSRASRAGRRSKPRPIIGTKSSRLDPNPDPEFDPNPDPEFEPNPDPLLDPNPLPELNPVPLVAAGSGAIDVAPAHAPCRRIQGHLVGIEHKFPLVVMGLLPVDLDRRLSCPSNPHPRSAHPQPTHPVTQRRRCCPRLFARHRCCSWSVPAAPFVVVPPIPVDEPNPLR